MYELTETTLDAMFAFMGWLGEHADMPLLEKFRAGCDRGLAPLCACDCILCVAHVRGELPDAMADMCRSLPSDYLDKFPMSVHFLVRDFVAAQPPYRCPW